ncbi:MAG TPA: YjbQ family protein, partial [Hyphomicrobiaceae bacterium]|nr:YjbQ family protein [Hyphomicrobiaceae bacterium]
MSRRKGNGAVGVEQSLETVKTAGRGFTDITELVRRWLEDIAADCGTVSLFLRHTSASLVIQENTD